MTEANVDHLAMIEGYLIRAKRYIAAGEARISRQKAFIAEQARTGRDTTRAIRTLQIMRDTFVLLHSHQELFLRQQKRASQACMPPTLSAARHE